VTVPRYLLPDEPTPGIHRLTLNRPEKRNALDNVVEGWFGITTSREETS